MNLKELTTEELHKLKEKLSRDLELVMKECRARAYDLKTKSHESRIRRENKGPE